METPSITDRPLYHEHPVFVEVALVFQGVVQETFRAAVTDRRAGLLTVGFGSVAFGEAGSVADVASVVVQVAVLALTAWGTTRTDSLVVPAGTYVAFFVTG